MDEFTRADRLLDEGKGAEAMAVFHKVAETGRLAAMHSIAHTYLYGVAGVEQNHDLAFKWFTRAASLGCPQAMYHLGLCNAMGYGTPKNPDLALHWYTQSAGHGDEDAMYRVGDCYENGVGAEKNLDQAVAWYRRAAKHGQPEAIERLHQLGR